MNNQLDSQLEYDPAMDKPMDPSNHGSHGERNKAPKKKKPIGIILLLGVAALVVLAVVGIKQRAANTDNLRKEAQQDELQIVTVVNPQRAPATVTLDLPGQTQAYIQAPIFAQVNGYLKKWYYDIGAKVKKGDVLAEIDTPTLDQQLVQAQATLKQAEAALWLSQATYNRDDDLLKKHVIAQQDFDNQAGDLRVKQATVNADAASVAGLEATRAFRILHAPFDGIVSSRNTDIGALINAGSGNALFTVSQVAPLRVYVNVPENLAAYVKQGTQADLTFDTFPGRQFPAEVVHTAGAIDPGTRTLLTELQIPNRTEELFPGAYARVHLHTDGNAQALLVPSNVLLFRAEGPAVGVVNPEGKVTIKKVKIGRDLGTKLEIVEGLSTVDRVIINPSDSLSDGAVVQVAKPASHPVASTGADKSSKKE